MVKGARILALAWLVWRDLADAATLSLLRPFIEGDEEARLVQVDACFNHLDLLFTYSRCCWCPAPEDGEDAVGGLAECWFGTDMTRELCCVFPFGHWAGDPSRILRHVPCRHEDGVTLEEVGLNLGRFRPTVRQAKLDEGNKGIILWTQGFLLAKLIAAGWLPPAFDRPLKVLEVAANLGAPSFAAAQLGHDVVMTDLRDEVLQHFRENAGRAAAGRAPRIGIEPLDLYRHERVKTHTGRYDVLLLSIEYLSGRLVRSLFALCGNRSRVLLTARAQGSGPRGQDIVRGFRTLRRFFEVDDELSDVDIVRSGFLPTGFKIVAMELRPKRPSMRKRTSLVHYV